MKARRGVIQQLMDELARMQWCIDSPSNIGINERKGVEEKIVQVNERLQYLLTSTSALIYTAKPSHEYGATFVNKNIVQITGYEPEEFVKNPSFWIDHVHPDDKKRVLSEAKNLFKTGRYTYEYRFRCKDGAYIWVCDEMKLVKDKNGKPLEIIGYWVDITERKKSEEELKKNEEEFRLIFENAKDAIFWADPETGIIIRCNKAAERLLKKSRNEIIGYSQTTLHPPEKLECYSEMFKKHVNQKQAIDEEAEIITRSGKIKPVHITASITSVGGRPIIQGIFRDITERKRTEKELKSLNRQLKMSNRKLSRLALKDPQTGLYNHRYFEEIIESEFYRAKRHGQPLSLIMLDIDYFKSINDVYGHQFGDLVLRQFSKKLRKLVRLHDYVIRYGDEEFVIVLPGSNRAGTLRLGQRISDFMKTHSFGDGKNEVKLRLSVAVVSYPEDDIIFKCMDFIETAERILNMVKEGGGNRVCSSSDIKGNIFPEDRKYKTTDIKFMKQRLLKITRESNQSLTESIFAFAKTIELKDRYTGGHVENTVYYATEIARSLDLSKTDTRLVEQASILHDLGKIGISENILLKKGKLTKFEFEKIKEHPKIGVDIIRPIQFLRGLIPLILYHHERWDGKGYPCGLKGKEIPVGARIIAIADVYQALISDRPYRKAFSGHEAIRIIKENSGTQFDSTIVDAFLEILLKRNSNPSKFE